MNKAILIGNLTRDPESTTLSGGIQKCTFTVACQRRYANADGKREADFIPVVCWRQTAELCAKYLAKGRKVAIEGTIQTRSYDAQDGTKRYVTEVIADNVEFLGSSQRSADPGPTPPPERNSAAPQLEDGTGWSRPPHEGRDCYGQMGFEEIADDECPF